MILPLFPLRASASFYQNKWYIMVQSNEKKSMRRVNARPDAALMRGRSDPKKYDDVRRNFR